MTLRELSWAINALTMCVVVTNALLLLRYRRQRYSAGWIEGRLAMLMSMQEAQQRGMPVRDWIISEAQRDAANHLPELAAKLHELGIEDRAAPD